MMDNKMNEITLKLTKIHLGIRKGENRSITTRIHQQEEKYEKEEENDEKEEG